MADFCHALVAFLGHHPATSCSRLAHLLTMAAIAARPINK
jgi:hypothetical protein